MPTEFNLNIAAADAALDAALLQVRFGEVRCGDAAAHRQATQAAEHLARKAAAVAAASHAERVARRPIAARLAAVAASPRLQLTEAQRDAVAHYHAERVTYLEASNVKYEYKDGCYDQCVAVRCCLGAMAAQLQFRSNYNAVCEQEAQEVGCRLGAADALVIGEGPPGGCFDKHAKYHDRFGTTLCTEGAVGRLYRGPAPKGTVSWPDAAVDEAWAAVVADMTGNSASHGAALASVPAAARPVLLSAFVCPPAAFAYEDEGARVRGYEGDETQGLRWVTAVLRPELPAPEGYVPPW
jgi:hypothetical protein